MRLDFGKFKGHDLSDPAIPDDYMRWLADRGSYQEPGNRFVTMWKVPIVTCIEARRELEKRGWRHNGYRWKLDSE